jgi:hypothetical protein
MQPSAFAIELYKVRDLAPEPRQHLGVAALEHKLTPVSMFAEETRDQS